jgi:hypothetical protein
MKSTVAILAVLVLSSVLADKTNLHETMESMLALAEKASNAEEKVMKVLNDLRDSITEEENALRDDHDN